MAEIGPGPEPMDRSSSSINQLFGGLTRFWLNGILTFSGTDDQSRELKLLCNRAKENGFLWIAMEFAELIGRIEQRSEFTDFAAKVRQDTGMVSIVDAVLLEEPWKRRLKALISVTGENEILHERSISSSRLIWLIGYDNDSVSLTAREQRVTTRNTWSKGRPIALSRMYTGRNLDFLTEQDRRVCKAIRRQQTNQNVTYQIDTRQALPVMVGHPLLFLEESPEISVEFVKGEPELLVEKKDKQLYIRLLKEISEEGVSVIRETPTRFKIIEVTDRHKNIARIVSQNGLQVPEDAIGQVMAALSNISSFMTVHSAIAVDTEVVNAANGKTGQIKEIPAQAGIYVQLIPLGVGFRLAMFVKPFGPEGPYMKPGHGEENVMAEVDGQRLQTRRDLELEELNSRELLKFCPTLTELEETGREWLLQETDICLQVLLELQDAKDRLTIEWPEGERIAVRSVASLENLKLRIRGKPHRHGLSWFEMSGGLELDESQVVDMDQRIPAAVG
jgi:hypothetical protein